MQSEHDEESRLKLDLKNWMHTYSDSRIKGLCLLGQEVSICGLGKSTLMQ